MNMNVITYGKRRIEDENLAIGGGEANNLMLYHGMIGEELKPDTFSFNLIYDKRKLLFLIDANGKYLQDANGKFLVVKADDFDPEAFRFGDTLEYYINDGAIMVGQFYVQTVKRIAKKIYRFTCTSGIGMTTYYGHNGGIYESESLGNIVREIMGNIPYTIDADLADVTCNGWLPKVKAARDNLQALLFMSGSSVKKNPNGTINFGYIGSGVVKTIPDVNLNVGGSIENFEPATRVEVTSHEYHALQTDERITLYENTTGVAATHLVVDFTEPCHDLEATGLTIEESGANYAVVTGIGTLTGQKYTHVTSVYAIDTGRKSEPNVIQVSNNFMVNPGNVANVAKRVAGYYSIAKEVSYTMRVTDERPGDKVTFRDPFGDQQTGYIKNMHVTLSKRLNAAATIALDWTPGPFGDAYSAYRVFRQADIVNGRLTFPTEMVGAQALVVLLSGAGGGQAGFDGQAGDNAHWSGPWDTSVAGIPANGGEGGAPGQSGERGRIYSFYVNALPSYYDNAAIGVGGAGGASNGALGSAGGDTTLDTYSTANGSQAIDDYTNFLTGDAYCTLNVAGESGNRGGIGSGYDERNPDTSTNGEPHICADGTWNGGAYKNGWTKGEGVSSGIAYHNAAGGGGGGAAHGANGGIPHNDPSTYDWRTIGGAGANAVAPPQALETQAGHGGHGGGGGGGASSGFTSYSWSSIVSFDEGTGGTGGLGSAGGQGGDGLIIVYYNPA